MAPKCNACGRFLAAAEAVTCGECSATCHRGCVNIPQGALVPATWQCPDCKARRPRINADCTPIKGSSATYDIMDTSMVDESKSTTATDTTLEMPDLYQDIRTFREEMKLAVSECRAWREEVAGLRFIMNKMGERLDKLEQKVENIEKLFGNKAREEEVASKALQATVQQLRLDLEERDQELLLNDVDIAGIPEEENESVQHLVLAIGTKLGVQLDDVDIVSCKRVGIRKAASAEAPRPRAITVRLARRSTRDQLIKAARVRRGLSTEGLGLRTEPRPVYVNERLTKTNRQLFNQAREIAKKLCWRFVWTREGRVYVRQEHGALAIRIRSNDDLERVFGREMVRPQSLE